MLGVNEELKKKLYLKVLFCLFSWYRLRGLRLLKHVYKLFLHDIEKVYDASRWQLLLSG